MTTDDITRMAREACDKDTVDAWHNGYWTITQEELHAFARLAEKPWRDAIDEKLIAHSLDIMGPDETPAHALVRLIAMHSAIDLDPSVSSEAQALIDLGARDALERAAVAVERRAGMQSTIGRQLAVQDCVQIIRALKEQT